MLLPPGLPDYSRPVGFKWERNSAVRVLMRNLDPSRVLLVESLLVDETGKVNRPSNNPHGIQLTYYSKVLALTLS